VWLYAVAVNVTATVGTFDGQAERDTPPFHLNAQYVWFHEDGR